MTLRPLHPRHRIDASPADLGFALLAAGLGGLRPDPVARAIADTWGLGAHTLVCLSVRSGLDLLLTALALPRGDEVVVSAITHPHMVRIIERHGLTAVPADLDPETLAPTPPDLERAVSERTRAVVITHLFGAKVDTGAAVALARRHNLLLIEDGAQSLLAARDCGDTRADVTMVSFGLIKTATALGGALVHVRDDDLAGRMAAIHDRWPVQSRGEYAGKALKAMAISLITRPPAYGALAAAGRRLGRSPDALVRGVLPSVPVHDSAAFAAWLRGRPSGTLLAVLRRRLHRFPAARLGRRAEAGDAMAAALPSTLGRPGSRLASTHWLFPVVTDNPRALIDGLLARGFDATQGTSQIAVVDPPADRPQLEPHLARALMAGMVFLPVYPEMPVAERQRLARAVPEVQHEHISVAARGIRP